MTSKTASGAGMPPSLGPPPPAASPSLAARALGLGSRGVSATFKPVKSLWGKGAWGKTGVIGGGVGLLAGAGALAGRNGNPLTPEDIEAINAATDEGGGRLMGTLAGAGAGAGLGGLGSLIYGKLSDKPDLQRDLIFALFGAMGGAGVGFAKSASRDIYETKLDRALGMQKIALDPLSWAIIGSALLASGTGLAATHNSNAQAEKNTQDMISAGKASQKQEQQTMTELQRRQHEQQNKMSRVGLSAAGGGAVGALASHLYGAKTNREDLRRDLIAALGGAALGGTGAMIAT